MSINDSPNRLGRIAPLLLLAAVFLAYAPALPGPYLWDDTSLIALNPTLDDDRNLPRYFFEDLGHFNQTPRDMGFYRPLQTLSFHLEVKAFGRNAPAQRTTNVLLHVVAVLSLFGLARRLLRSDGWGFFAALLYAWQPLCTEQICLIANRGGALTGSLSLLTLYCLARAFAEPARTRWTWFVLAALAHLGALLAKPEALVVVAPALAWLWLQPEPPRPIRAVAATALTGGLAVAFAVWHWVILGISHAHKAIAVSLLDRLLTIPYLTWQALRLSLFPVSLRAIRQADLAVWSTPSHWIPATAFWLVVIFLAWRYRRQSPAFTFAVVLFAAAMAPGSGLIALVRPVAEHYYYLPVAGICLALAELFRLAAGDRRNVVRIMAAFLAAIFFLGVFSRAAVWSSAQRLWSDNVAKEPQSSEALNNLGATYSEEGNAQEAVAIFKKAVTANPANLKARLNLAHGLTDLGRYPEAFASLEQILSVETCQTKALLLLGRLLAMSEWPEARRLAESPERDAVCRAWVLLGEALGLETGGRPAEARLRFEAFLALAPAHPQAAAVRHRLATTATETISTP